MERETLVINLLGAPGSGKSTLAAELFAAMKVAGASVELVTEYAKELVWEKRSATFDDELYIFAKQNHRLFRVNGKVDFIVTDCPVLQKLCYMPEEFDFSSLVLDVYNQYRNINFFLERGAWHYEAFGRNQSERESIEISRAMKEKLDLFRIPYTSVPEPARGKTGAEFVLKKLEERGIIYVQQY